MAEDIRADDDRDEAMLALEGELQARADAIARLRRDLDACIDSHQKTNAEEERLRQLLLGYGRHAEGCSAAYGDEYRCRCGWREVEAQEGG